jgi:N utilization substance protein A
MTSFQLAIGRRGQNVRLASQLTGWSIDILTEETESNRRSAEFNRLSNLFVDALNVEEVIAHLLVTEGFTSIEEVAYVPMSDLASIEGFDEMWRTELRDRANSWIEAQAAEKERKLKELGVAKDLLDLEGITTELALKLGEKGIKTRDDLAELASDEFAELIPDNDFSDDEVNALIMRARAHWFEGDDGQQVQAG